MKARTALEQSLLLTLSITFVFDPGALCWLGQQAGQNAAWREATGAPSLLERAGLKLRRALDALDHAVFPRIHALEPSDLVRSDTPDGFRDVRQREGWVELPLAGDEAAVTLSIGFDFPYYGQTFSQVAVTTNGYLVLGGAFVQDVPDPIPSGLTPNGVIAPFWDDLDFSANPGARASFVRLGPANRAFVVQWTDVPLKGDPDSRLTFQVVLMETGEVQLHYGPLHNGDGTATGRASGATAAAGVESPDGTRGVQVALRQEGALRQGRSFAFTVGGPPLAKGQLRGDYDEDGRITVLDQVRLVDVTHGKGRPATARELLLGDVAPRADPESTFGDGALDAGDNDLFLQVIAERTALNPVLARVSVDAPSGLLVLEGAGFDPSSAAKNTVVFTTAAGTTSAEATTVDATGTELRVPVPASARLGPVRVVAFDRTSNAARFVPPGQPVITGIFPSAARVGEEVVLHGVELSTGAVVLVNGVPAAVRVLSTDDEDDRLAFTVPAGVTTGTSTVVVKVGDAASPTFAFGVADDPVAVLTSPLADEDVRGLLEIRGTATDPSDFASYTLELERLIEGGGTTVIGSGTAPVVSGVLGTLDPTILINGFYSLRLRVIDQLGFEKVARAEPLQIKGDQKLGVFTLSFQDMTVPVVGIPVTVVRTYDSREKRSQDFGYGWRLTLSTVELEEDLAHNVYVTMADGRRVAFRFTPEPTSNPLLFKPKFTPEPGVFDELQNAEGPIDLFLNFGRFFTLAGEEFDPSDYVLTMKQGTKLALNDVRGLERITDSNGNQVTFTRDGVLHGSGVSLRFTRDAQGRITEIKDPANASTRYEYDAGGDLVAVTDRMSHRTMFTYEDSHYLVDIFDPSGVRAVRNEYDALGRLAATADAEGNQVRFAHDAAGRRETFTDRLGHTRVVEFDLNGDVTAATNELGHTTRHEYDGNRNKVSTTNALGHRTTRTFDAEGNELTETNPLGHTWVWTYGGRGRITSITDPRGGRTEHTYDVRGNLVATKNPTGAVTTYAIDSRGLVQDTKDALGNTTRFEYSTTGLLTASIDALGLRTEYEYNALGNQVLEQLGVRLFPFVFRASHVRRAEYDASGRLTTSIDPLGKRSTIEYGPNGMQSAIVDPLGRTTSFAYTRRGEVAATTFPDGTTSRSIRDSEGRVTAAVDQAGRRMDLTRDALGRVTEMRFADGARTLTAYDAIGQITTETSPRGARTSYEYDAAGRRTRVVNELGQATSFEHDSVGNLTAVTDAKGRTTRFAYNQANQLVTTHFPDGTSTVMTYDELGRKVAETDQAGVIVFYVFDALGRLEKMIDGEGGVTVFARDDEGRVVARTDPAGRVTRFAFDAAGRLTTTTRPLGMQQAAEYDDADQITAFTNFNGERTRFERDPMGRLSRKILPDGRTVDYTHTATGRRLTINDSVRGVTRYAYDPRDRLSSRTEPDGLVVSYAYDSSGNRTACTTPIGTTRYTFDPLDRMETVTAPQGGTSRYAHDEVGLLTSLTYPNGVIQAYAYDDLDRLRSVTATRSDGTTIASYNYTYGPAGNRQSVVEQDGRAVLYLYDRKYQLIRESIAEPGAAGPLDLSYRYDRAGNRLEKTTAHPDGSRENTVYSFNDNDWLVEETLTRGGLAASTVYAHDASGATTLISSPTGETRFAWTPDRRLAAATTTGGGAVTSLRFVYDDDGIRTERWEGARGVRFLIDEESTYEQAIEERDAESGALIASYVHGEDLISSTRGAQTSFFLQDGQMSVRVLTDAIGEVSNRYDYDAFGVALLASGDSANTYRFTGESHEAALDAYYLRARYYSPSNGRMLSEDFGETDSFHRYAYVGNDPINTYDPSGHESLSNQTVTTATIGTISTISVPYVSGITLQLALFLELVGTGTVFSASVGAVAATALPVLIVVARQGRKKKPAAVETAGDSKGPKFYFRADDDYVATTTMNQDYPLGYSGPVDHDDPWEHVMDHFDGRTSLFTSWSLTRARVTPKFGRNVWRIERATVDALESAPIPEVILWTSDAVKNLVDNHPTMKKKEKKRYANVKSVMDVNDEVLIQGAIPGRHITPAGR